MIALEILKAGKEINYFKQHIECDFIIKSKNKLIPVQVCYSIQNQDTWQREIKGLLFACKFLKQDIGYIVTFDEEKSEQIENVNIVIMPAFKFMLEFLNQI
jgi:predicted AAA+ superfamily ATPase